MKKEQKNSDLSARLVISRNDEQIRVDLEFLRLILPAGEKLCKEILAYPLVMDLDGNFEDTCGEIKKHIPVNRPPGGKFDTSERAPRWDGTPQFATGYWLLREFERKQKELLYEKTGGRISDEITLAKDAFTSAVQPKDGTTLLEAANTFFGILYHSEESAQRLSNILFFKDGILQAVPDAKHLIEEYHTVYANKSQSALYDALRPVLQSLSEIGIRFNALGCIQQALSKTCVDGFDFDHENDRKWLQFGTNNVEPDIDPEDDDSTAIGGQRADGSFRNRLFKF